MQMNKILKQDFFSYKQIFTISNIFFILFFTKNKILEIKIFLFFLIIM